MAGEERGVFLCFKAFDVFLVRWAIWKEVPSIANKHHRACVPWQLAFIRTCTEYWSNTIISYADWLSVLGGRWAPLKDWNILSNSKGATSGLCILLPNG